MFKIRCSAISQIMAQPRSKAAQDAGELGDTAKTYCETWLKQKMYDRTKDFSSKYTQKGIEVELKAIEFISDYLNLGMVFKNQERFGNDYIEGTPDLLIPEIVIDNKSSWDCFTFPLFDEEPPKTNWWQMQGYMELTGRSKAKVIYTLMDAPDWLIYSEINKWARINGMEVDEIEPEVYEALEASMKYSNLPAHKRIKVFEFGKDQEAIKAIEAQVLKCRSYICKIEKQLKWNNQAN